MDTHAYVDVSLRLRDCAESAQALNACHQRASTVPEVAVARRVLALLSLSLRKGWKRALRKGGGRSPPTCTLATAIPD